MPVTPEDLAEWAMERLAARRERECDDWEAEVQDNTAAAVQRLEDLYDPDPLLRDPSPVSWAWNEDRSAS
jgi:hypothetical protein